MSPADRPAGTDAPPRAIRVILGPDPWGGIRQPALQRWALSRARLDLVVYLGPQVIVPEVALGDRALDAAAAVHLVHRWIQLAGHLVRGVYVIPRLEQVRLAHAPERLALVSGVLEQWLAARAQSPVQVVLGYPEARWLGPPPSSTWAWPLDAAAPSDSPVPPPWPSAHEHPLAIVVGARPEHAGWLRDLASRAPAWRWVLAGALPGPPWPPEATPVPWPLWTDALAQVRVAAALVVPPEAEAAAVAAWRALPEARRLPCVGDSAAPGPLAMTARDYARALACVTWDEPTWLAAVRP